MSVPYNNPCLITRKRRYLGYFKNSLKYIVYIPEYELGIQLHTQVVLLKIPPFRQA